MPITSQKQRAMALERVAKGRGASPPSSVWRAGESAAAAGNSPGAAMCARCAHPRGAGKSVLKQKGRAKLAGARSARTFTRGYMLRRICAAAGASLDHRVPALLQGIVGFELFDDFGEELGASPLGEIDLVEGDLEHGGDLRGGEILVDVEGEGHEGG